MKIFHVTLRGGGTEGFITDDARDADWTSTGRPNLSMRPAIGDEMRDFLEAEDEVLPRKYALLFDTEQEALDAAAKLTKRSFIAINQTLGTAKLFTDEAKPGWMESWFWEQHVLSLEVGKFAQTDFQRIYRVS